jgi:glycine cleavage system T protein
LSEPIRSPLADYHLSQGATLAEYRGGIVPARFSAVNDENRAVRTAAGLFDFSFRAKIAMTGADRVRFLHGMVSNDIKKLAPGKGTYAAMLTAQGHVLADMCIFCTEARLIIDTDASLRDKVIAGLKRYIIADKVVMEPAPLFTLAFQGPRARPLLEKTLHIELPALEEFGHFATNYAGFPVRVVRVSSTGEEGYEVWMPEKAMMPVWGAACGQAPTYDMLPCGSEALETLRIEAGIPLYGTELGEDTLLLEANLLNAVSLTKGCYIGQENVERTRTRGHVNWKLVGLTLAGPLAPPPETKLIAEGKEIGEITSSCVSPTLGKTIALAYVRREFAEVKTKLNLASGIPVEVTAHPFYSRHSSQS